VERHVVRIGRSPRPRPPIGTLLERATFSDSRTGEPEGSEG
jgi:hypothetical protein